MEKRGNPPLRGPVLSGCQLNLGQLDYTRAGEQQSLHTIIALCADLYWQENVDGVCTAVCSYSECTENVARQLIDQRLADIGREFPQNGLEEPGSDWQQYLDCINQRKPFRQLRCVVNSHADTGTAHCYLQISGLPQYNEAGDFLGYECVAVDITRERNQEAHLQRFRAAMDMSMDMIYLVDRETLSFIDFNDTACRNSGLSREQLMRRGPVKTLGMSRKELITRYDGLINEGRNSRIERELKGPSGQPVIVEVFSRALQVNGKWLIIGVSRDVTQRKMAERKAQRLQRLFSALSLVNESILRADSLQSLYEGACNAAVTSQLFNITSVLVPSGTGHFIAVSSVGKVLPIMAKTRVGSDPSQPEGNSLTARAMQEGKAYFSNDFTHDERTTPWHELAEQHGIRSAAALPLLERKRPVAVIVFYSAELNAFDEQTQSILQSIADNMSFALDNFANAADQARAAGQIRQNEERFRSLTNLSSDFYWEMDTEFRFTLYEGRSGEASNRQAVEQAIHRTLRDPQNVITDTIEQAQLRRQLKKAQPFHDMEFSFYDADGVQHHLSLSGEPMLDAQGQFSGYRGITRDITNKKRITNRIKHLATHDTLTDLPNRIMFSQLLRQAIRNANRYKEQRFAVLFIDLDRFKNVNDSYGHHTGDLLLAEVAKRLKSPLRESDIVARLGGDEFVVLLQKVSDKDQACAVAASMLRIFNQPIRLEQREFLIGASIGISIFGVDAFNEESLMTHADTAMYAAKEEGRNGYRLYSADLHQHREQRAGLAVELRHALSRGELRVEYQAKVALKSSRLVGVEALLRWHHPTLGEIPPSQFIPIAEDNGLIISIGEWVLATACRQVLAWQQAGMPALELAVNLSTRQFNHPELPTYIDRLLADIGFPARQLELEITESLVVQNPERAIRLMQDMKRSGIRFALDDFGTGYSSLGQLRHYPIDTLKIDRAFVKDLATSREDQAISKAIISMSKTLGMTVVAEGVESAAQLELLRRYQCDQVQGFFYHKPCSAEAFTHWYQQQRDAFSAR